MKAAFSDALKRAAVKAGIGRYLYRLPSTWVAYDPPKKAMATTPKLPDWALPGQAGKHAIRAAVAKPEPAIRVKDLEDEDEQPARRISEAQEKELARLIREREASVDRLLV